MRAVWTGAGLLGLLAVGAASGLAFGKEQAAAVEPASAQERPNILFILTDDEDVRSHAFMPKTKALIEDQGISFDNYFVTYSFCCPSRATTLRGQYSFNHRIQGNVLPTGGARKFRATGLDKSTVATWLQTGGYYTGYFGKYMNDYEPEESTYFPPGWDEWYGAGHDYYRYVLNENGKHVYYGRKPEDYLTDVLARHARAAIRRVAATDEPFFFIVAPYAPHAPSITAPRHAHMFADTPYPRPPSFDERDVSDKPSLIRNQSRLEPWQVKAIEKHYRQRLRSLQAVDDLVETLVALLEETGELDNTYVIYTSDNGWHMGEHRQFVGKTTAYEEDIRVPFVMRGPGVPRGESLDALVINNDLAPTFAAMAGVKPPSFVDGRSFLPLLSDSDIPWRKSFAIERQQRETFELVGPASFRAIRMAHWTYVEYRNGERELYDLRRDPHQLHNIAATADKVLLTQLATRLVELTNCAAQYCRRIEDAPLAPAMALHAGEEPKTAKQ